MLRSRLTPVLLLASLAAGCRGDTPGRAAVDAGGQEGLEGELLVSAAASLTDAFAAMAAAFEAAHPGVDVLLNLGGSSSLGAQILEGAPVDVFAPAAVADMDRVAAAGLVAGAPRVLARNLLVLAVPRENPAGVTGLADFRRPELRLGLCAPQVPCGALARRVLEGAGVVPALDTEEPDVRALLTKIELGELDAGITYVTDVASAGGGVEGIPIPEALNAAAAYPIAVLATAPHPEVARAFVAFALSDGGRAILAAHGFTLP